MRNNLKRRLKQLEGIIRPSDSLEARLEKLSPMQAAMYRAYRERYDRWTARHVGENIYAAMIDDPPPNLPSALRAVLFPDYCPPLEGDTEAIAARKYQDLLDGVMR